MTSTLSQLESLLEELIALGEDAQELGFWKSIFPSLTAQEQEELLQNLQAELTALKS